MDTVRSILGIKREPSSFTTPHKQNMEAIEDYSVKKVVRSQEMITGDHHVSGTKPEVINVCYGTDVTPPDATTVPIGTLYIQYVE